ncbi:MAG: hypothetical protein ACRDPQ_12435 [Nocardioidaceae bacterium]
MLRITKIAALAATALSATAILATAPAATAAADQAREGDTRPCVTLGEFLKVHRGMLQADVHRIFDTKGHYQAAWSDPWYEPMRDVYRDYRPCPGFNQGHRIEINFDNYWHDAPGLRVYSKTARP